jgi:hypothetical protein
MPTKRFEPATDGKPVRISATAWAKVCWVKDNIPEYRYASTNIIIDYIFSCVDLDTASKKGW